MEIDDIEAPDVDRLDSKSALDFTYWVLTYVDADYGRNAVLTPSTGDEDPGEAMMQAIAFASSQIGLYLQTPDFTKFKKHCLRHPVALSRALRDRGGILFKGSNVAVSLGDSKRVMEYLDDVFVTRYLTKAEMEDGVWESCRIPDMIYL